MRDISEWLPDAGESVLCGVSGGVDSMVLLDLLRDWCAAHGGSVTAAHYNHHLRPTAYRDECFVRDWCAGHAIAFVSGGGDVQAYAVREGLSVEEAARKLRYDFLRREAGTRRIYVAHHAGDNAETILWNLIRGTGLRGLSGMSHEQGGIVRPLLDVPRSEIEAYAAEHRIPHVEDETNADPDAASRNLLRLEVMPLLRRLNPRAEEHVCAAGGHAALLQASMEAQARRHMVRAETRTGFAAMPVRDLSDAPPELRPLILLDLFERTGAGRKDVGAAHLRAALNLLDNAPGKRVDLPHGVTASVRDGWLLLETRPVASGERTLIPNVPLRWGDYELTLEENVPLEEGIDVEISGNSIQNCPTRRDAPPSPHAGRASRDCRQGKRDDFTGNVGLSASPAQRGRCRVAAEGGTSEHSLTPMPEKGETTGLFLRAGNDTVTVRPCPAGERLTLPGSNGSRTLKRLCADRRISLRERDTLPAFYVAGRLAAVWRIGTDAAFVPDTPACRFIRVKYPVCGK
ncbi:MAG: tRNA lysidine(34) synthetase TilS [Oscillospiraceae bacterium]|nr:tRNA lysidine(34) synthetase TilS [Oscillospiraceae bacterium]